MSATPPFEFRSATPNDSEPDVTDVSCEEIAKLLGKALPFAIVDVRNPSEFTGELGHIPGARLIPLPELSGSWAEVKRAGHVVFVCRSGGRSAQAAAMFAMQDSAPNPSQRCWNLAGGMTRWNALGLPTEYNEPEE